MSLAHRQLVPELMDDPNLDTREHQRALAGLRRINFWSGTSRRIAREILSRSQNLASIRVLDLGAGGGEVAAGVFSRLTATGKPCHFQGWDFSATAVDLANQSHGRQLGGSTLEFVQANAFAGLDEREEKFDFVYCSLFLHHFDDPQAIEILVRMRQRATVLVLVDDLIRSRAGLCLAHFGCQLLTRSSIVHFDGPQSVRAAFSVNEAHELARRAGMSDARITQHWPQRFTIQWCA